MLVNTDVNNEPYCKVLPNIF